MNLTFAHPLALLALLVVPLLAWSVHRSTRAFPLPRASALGDRGGRAAAVLAASPWCLRALALVAIVLAIAGPATAAHVVEERSEGVPIVLAVDISSSMLAQDFQPRDRLGVARSVLSRFITSRESDPIGLVAFAGEALTVVPATTHRPVLLSALESIDVGLLEDGTALGDGLAAAVNRARSPSGAGAVVMLSDGENNRGVTDPLAAADAAAAFGVRVFTIGVGSEGVAPVPVGRAPAGFRYREMPVALDEEMLRAIAARTDAAYFRATDPETLDRVLTEIDRLVPSVVETVRRVESTPWSAVLLAVAAIALTAESLLRGSRWGPLP